MNKQDMQGVRTPLDLERKYDLAAIVGMKKAVLQAENQITKINSTLEKFIISTLGSLENMQSQIDGNITTWFNSGEPTPETYPTNEWETEEEKINHIGDLYYDRNTGYAYRYESTEENTYNWEKIRDNDVVEALAIANAAKDTADNKRRVFVVQPTPPYECGDLWITSEGEIYICQIEKDDKQTYAEKDFVVATKYTDDTYAKQVENQLQVVRGAVTTIVEGMDRFSVDIDTLENDMTVAKTQIFANTSQIALSVLKDAVIASINMSNEDILIQAKRLNLTGAVTMSSLAEDVAEEINEISDNAANAVETANQANSNVNAALTRATCHYGTCSTAAATVAKVVTLSGFELYTGAQVSVKFTNANTATNPTLNVNSTGAKSIRVNNANITAQYYWAAGNTVTFVYDGSYWVMADSTANSILASWCYNNNKTIIDGGKLAAGTVTAEKINVADLAALNATIGGWAIGTLLSASAQVYVPPGQEEYDKVRNYILNQGSLTANELKYFDLNNSGTVTQQDMLLIKKIILGTQSYSACANAAKSTVTAQIDPTNPNALVYLTATTPWGVKKEAWIGVAELFASCVRGKVISGDVVQTTAGVDLDTINSNLATVAVGSITPSYTGYTADYRIFKYNKLVIFQISSLWLGSITAQSWITLGTVPDEYKPIADSVLAAATISNASNGNVLGVAKVEILTTGVIRVKSSVSSSSAIGVSAHLSWHV